jgi:hypothetical protein
VDIRELQKKIIEFRDARDWAQYHNPKDLAISLSLEASELLEVLQWKDPQEVEAIRRNPGSRRRVKEQRGVCHAFGFDLSEVILEKLRINEKKYPVEKAKGSARKYTET